MGCSWQSPTVPAQNSKGCVRALEGPWASQGSSHCSSTRYWTPLQAAVRLRPGQAVGLQVVPVGQGPWLGRSWSLALLRPCGLITSVGSAQILYLLIVFLNSPLLICWETQWKGIPCRTFLLYVTLDTLIKSLLTKLHFLKPLSSPSPKKSCKAHCYCPPWQETWHQCYKPPMSSTCAHSFWGLSGGKPTQERTERTWNCTFFSLKSTRPVGEIQKSQMHHHICSARNLAAWDLQPAQKRCRGGEITCSEGHQRQKQRWSKVKQQDKEEEKQREKFTSVSTHAQPEWRATCARWWWITSCPEK